MTQTRRPDSSEHKCPFGFSVNWDANKTNRWYIRRDTQAIFEHHHHLPHLEPFRRTSDQTVPQSLRPLLKTLFEHQQAPSFCGKAIVEALTGNSVPGRVMDTLRTQIISQMIPSGDARNKPKTQGMLMLDYLQNEDDIDYVYITASSKSEATGLHTVRKSKHRNLSLNKISKTGKNSVKDIQNDELDALCEGLTVNNEGEVLVLAAWRSKTQKK